MTSPGMIDQAVLQNLSNLAALCFQKAGVEALTNVPLVLCKSGEIQDHASAKALILPTNKPVSDTITSTWSFPFGRTHLQVYDALPCPDGWTPLPNEKNPAWYRSPGGSLMASWNLWGVMIDMFSFGEERRNKLRDQHGRFPIEASPRYGAGLTSVPLVNNALAQIIDAALHLENSSHSLLSGVQDVVLPPAVVLSHDLDNLTGNSLWTQLSRGFRAAKFALKLQPAALH